MLRIWEGVSALLSNYANQSLTWKQAGALNEYAEPTYTSTTIKGRKETGFKLIRNAQGQEIVSSAKVFTESEVEANDLIDGKLVIAVTSQVNLNGSVEFYEVWLT